MANVPAIVQFVDDVNVALNALIIVREDLNATDHLWPDLNATAKAAIKARITANLADAKTLVAALQVP